MKPLSVCEVAELLQRSPGTRAAILVGGQALNVWAVRFGLAEERAAVSSDIDFFGSKAQAIEAGVDWRARAVHRPSLDDHTPNSAVVVINLDSEERGIDFMASIAGVDSDELRRWAGTVHARDYDFRVMHPLHVLQSQLENVYGRLKRRDEAGGDYFVARVALAVQVAACSIAESLESKRERDALKAAERIGDIAGGQAAINAWQRDAVDVLGAIPQHRRWPKRFSRMRLPQMRERVGKKRMKVAASKARRRGT